MTPIYLKFRNFNIGPNYMEFYEIHPIPHFQIQDLSNIVFKPI